MFANVEQVCPDSRAGCAPLADASRSEITFAVAPQSVVFSPSQQQLVVVSGAEGVDAGTVLVVSLPNAAQIDRPTRTAVPASSPASSSASTTPLLGPAIWLPAIDPTGRFAAYWSGTVVLDPAGAGWKPATGRLILDGWSEPLRAPRSTPAPTAAHTGSPEPAPSASGAGPAASLDAGSSGAASTAPSASGATPSPDVAAPPTEAPATAADTAPPATEALPSSSGGVASV